MGPLGTAALPAAGGTSGIIIDNTVGATTVVGGSQIYFSTLERRRLRRRLRGPGIATGITIDRQTERQMGFPLMAMNDSSSDNSRTSVTKKPYEKPSFRFEKVFVTTALSCGKVGATSQDCIQHSSAS